MLDVSRGPGTPLCTNILQYWCRQLIYAGCCMLYTVCDVDMHHCTASVITSNHIKILWTFGNIFKVLEIVTLSAMSLLTPLQIAIMNYASLDPLSILQYSPIFYQCTLHGNVVIINIEDKKWNNQYPAVVRAPHLHTALPWWLGSAGPHYYCAIISSTQNISLHCSSATHSLQNIWIIFSQKEYMRLS